MMNEEKIKRLIFISAAVCAAAIVIMGILLIIKAVGGKTTSAPMREIKPSLLEERIKNSFINFGIPEKNIKFGIDLEEQQKTITIFLPKGKLIEEFVALLFDAAQNSEHKVIESKHISKGKRYGGRGYVKIVFENRKKPREKIVCEIIPTNEVSSQSAKVAFIIKGLDKLSKEKSDSLLAFTEPLNYILTPWQTVENRKITDTIPQIFKNILSPVLIEIPMEDLEIPYAKRKYTIIQSDDRKKIDEKIKTLIKMYPQAAGFYSKTGGLILNSRGVCETFLYTIKKNDVLFFDARTSKNEIAREIAAELNVKYDTVTISIQKNWEAELKNICDNAIKNKNSFVLISADNNFVDVFVKKLPEMQKKIQFVPITKFHNGG